jgi:clan AA aspartic protease
MVKLSTKKVTKLSNKRTYKTGKNDMGLVFAEIELTNGGDAYMFRQGMIEEAEIKQIMVNALVDSGAYMLTINNDVRNQLDLPFIEKQLATLADETQVEIDIVGPVDVRFENRSTTCRAVVLPNAGEVLLGAIPMEDMDVLIHPREEKLVVNPKHPYVANKYLK